MGFGWPPGPLPGFVIKDGGSGTLFVGADLLFCANFVFRAVALVDEKPFFAAWGG
jgi:hypothetical protein